MTDDHELPRPDLPRPVLPSELSASIYASLHELASRQLRDQRQNSLQPTSLVHEAWLRIAKLRELRGEQRAQFFALAGKAMRSVVVDHARRRLAHKRDGGRSSGVDPDATSAAAGPAAHELLALDEALQRLEAADPESVRVVDLLFFAGKTAAEAAELLGTSSRTVERRWRFARAWLRDCLGGIPAPAVALAVRSRPSEPSTGASPTGDPVSVGRPDLRPAPGELPAAGGVPLGSATHHADHRPERPRLEPGAQRVRGAGRTGAGRAGGPDRRQWPDAGSAAEAAAAAA